MVDIFTFTSLDERSYQGHSGEEKIKLKITKTKSFTDNRLANPPPNY